MDQNLATLLYLAASVCFILALRGLSHPETSRAGNRYGVIGMALAVVITLALLPEIDFVTILAGVVVGGSIGTAIALRIKMTALPQLVAAFHSLVGLAAVLVAAAAFYNPAAYGIGVPGEIAASSLIEMAIGTSIGAITFTGSVIAFAKLQALMSGRPIVFPLQHWLNLGLGILAVLLVVWLASAESGVAFWLIVVVSLVLGVLIIIPIGGADMPVVISMLNSYSGWAACGIGFTLQNNLLIVAGALVGSSGAILSYIMCKGMNRSFVSVILGGFGGEVAGPAAGEEGEKTHREGSAEDAAFIMRNAEKVIIVPGYGFAVAQAQHALREMADLLKAEGVEIHARSLFLQGALLLDPCELPPFFSPVRPYFKKLSHTLQDQGLSRLEACLLFGLQLKELDYLIIGVTERHELEEVCSVVCKVSDGKRDLTAPTLSDERFLNPTNWITSG
ncbi:MAG: NAD(P)(+) transhydrogenase (Re/Si-specific) subunit beta [Proteobacteria bacterium]|nr:NAD(P)(+) transhydrogenase (Re/Si-specific) subunit beta [Pseudomonadota bacterium]